MIQQFNIESFPKLILMKDNKKEVFKNERSIDTIINFLKKNVSNMV